MNIERLRGALKAGRLTISPLDDGSGVVLDVAGEQLLEMNASALAMLQAVADGAETEQAVAERIAERFEAPGEQVAADVHTFFAQLVASLKP